MTMLSSARSDPREWRRRLLPATTMLLASVLMTVPLPLAWAVMPNFALLLVLVWASVQPRLMPVWAAFMLGLWHDLLANLPLGVFGLIFPVCVLIVRFGEARMETRSILVDWLLVAIIVSAAYALAGQLLQIAGVSAPMVPMIVQAAATVLAFPLAVSVAALLHRRLVERWR